MPVESKMPTPTETKPTVEVKSAPAKKSFTNWDAFAKAGLRPVTVKCQAYKPVHLSDRSCHSNLMFTGEALTRHVIADHGGAIQLTLKKVDGSGSVGNFWKALAESGLEAYDFRCDICDKVLKFHPTSILGCMRAHNGKTRRVLPGGHYNITLGLGRGEFSEDDDYGSDESL